MADFWSQRYEGRPQQDVASLRAVDFTNAVLDMAEGEEEKKKPLYEPLRTSVFTDPRCNPALNNTAPENFTFERDFERAWLGKQGKWGGKGVRWSNAPRFPKKPRDKLNAGQDAMSTAPSLDQIYDVDHGMTQQSHHSLRGASLANRARRFPQAAPSSRRKVERPNAAAAAASHVGPGSYAVKNLWRLPQPGVGGQATFRSTAPRTLQDGRVVPKEPPVSSVTHALEEESCPAAAEGGGGSGSGTAGGGTGRGGKAWQRLSRTSGGSSAGHAAGGGAAGGEDVYDGLGPRDRKFGAASMQAKQPNAAVVTFGRSARRTFIDGAMVPASVSGARPQPFINFLAGGAAPKSNVRPSLAARRM